MKPPPFEYIAARDVAHALDVLAQANGAAKILAGGQSLMPMLNFRLARPDILIDINRIAGLDQIAARPDRLSFGPLVRHRTTATDLSVAARFPVLTHAMTHVAHHTVRNRGTFVGSLCHADPAAEMPMLALLLDATIDIAATRGMRRLAAREFFTAPLTTALEPDELVVNVDLPNLPTGTGWGFEEFSRRQGDFALAAAAVTLCRRNDRSVGVRIAVTGVADTPLRIAAAEQMLEASGMDRLTEIIAAVRDAVTPNTDLHASADYRRHLIGVLVRRAITAAWDRAA